MLESDPHKSALASRPAMMDAAQATFLGLALALFFLLAPASWALYGPSGAFALSLTVFAIVILCATLGLPRYHPYATLGGANIVTTCRAAMAAWISGAILMSGLVETAGWLIFTVALVAFTLDGLDGILARRAQMTSAFGARFDMEVDAVLGAALSLILLQSGKAGPEVLILGFMRYAFVAASLIWPWLTGSLPERLRRKAVCVMQIAALIILLCPLTPAALLMPVSVIASLVLAWSFIIDIVWLKRSAT